MNKLLKRRKAFTLMELIIVIGILGVLYLIFSNLTGGLGATIQNTGESLSNANKTFITDTVKNYKKAGKLTWTDTATDLNTSGNVMDLCSTLTNYKNNCLGNLAELKKWQDEWEITDSTFTITTGALSGKNISNANKNVDVDAPVSGKANIELCLNLQSDDAADFGATQVCSVAKNVDSSWIGRDGDDIVAYVK